MVQTPAAAVEALLTVYREGLHLLVRSQIEQHQERMGMKWGYIVKWKSAVALAILACIAVCICRAAWQ